MDRVIPLFSPKIAMLLADRNRAEVLPTPEDRPDADVVIYDGECVFCRGGVARCARWDWCRRLAFLSLHAPEVGRRYPDLLHQDLMAEMVVVDRQGKRHRGAQALRLLSRRLPILWPVAPILHIPGSLPLWRWLYAWVARNRYRFGGRTCETGGCRLDSAASGSGQANRGDDRPRQPSRDEPFRDEP